MAWARAVEDAETQSRRKEANLDHWFLRFLCAAVLHSLEFTEEGCGLWILTFLVSALEKGAGRGVLSPVAIEHARKDWRPKSIHNQNQTKKNTLYPSKFCHQNLLTARRKPVTTKKKISKKTIEQLIDTIPVQKDNRAPKTSRKKLSNRKEKKKTKNQERRVESMEEIWKKARWVLREKEMKIIIKLGPNKMGFFCYNGTKT